MNNAPFFTKILSYADVRDCKIYGVNMCYRDLKIIVDVLDTYAKQVNEHIQTTMPKNIWMEINNKEMAERIMRISDCLADAIGLDKTCPKCKKHLEKLQKNFGSDVGSDGISQTVLRGNRK